MNRKIKRALTVLALTVAATVVTAAPAHADILWTVAGR